METIKVILKEKGPVVHTTRPEESVLEATHRMNEHGVGALAVVDQGRLIGMFTERDVLRRVVAAEIAPSEVSVAEVMSTEVACCTIETSIDEARTVMKNRRIRHLPVMSPDGELLGLISIGDLNAYHANTQEETIHYLHEYLHGRC
jgi:CBS domain-containing protein